ncbi:hypothetical protein BDQ17DRAFT_1247125, partial [Cyathus striatus]
CLSTLFLCTWVAIHPSIPDPEEEGWKALWRRLKMMYCSLVIPELVLTWAVRQLLGARKIYNTYRKRNWTMNHAQFLQMGGFHLSSGEYRGVIGPKRFDQLLRERKITFPDVTKEEIQDKSKADGLSKIILVVQTLWFVIQCIGRHAQGLALAQLEVATLAVISSTFMLSVIWWHKPFDVQQPIYLDTTEAYSSRVTVLNAQRSGREHLWVVIYQHLSVVHRFIDCALRPLKGFYDTIRSIRDTVYKAVSESLSRDGFLATILNVFVLWHIALPAIKMAVDNGRIVAGRVSTYFAGGDGTTPNSARSMIKVTFIPSLCGALFGLVHCFAWNSHFSTVVEKHLWQASALGIAASPTLICLLLAGHDLIYRNEVQYPASILSFIFTMIYVASRYYLILKALLGLRSLPPSALETVQWSNFFPHVTS